MTGKSFWVSLLALAVAAACESSSNGGGVDAHGQAGTAPRGGGGSAPNTQGGTSAEPAGGTGSGNSQSGSGGTASGASGTNAEGGTPPNGGGIGNGGMDAAGGPLGEGGTNSGAGGEGGSDAADEVERVYISRVLGGVLAASLHTKDGAPSLLPGAAINPNGHATALAIDNSQKFVFVADENKHIDTYRIAEDGTLPTTADSSIATTDTLITLALDATGRFAYAGSQPGKAIYAFKITPATGVLSAVGQPLPVGDAPDHSAPAFIAAAPSGRFVYVTLAGEPGIRGYSVNQDGSLTELADSPFAKAGLPVGDLLFGGAIVFKPTGDFLYTVGGGLNAFAIDDASGKLTLVEGSPFTLDVQSDPNAPNIAIDPQGKYVYVTHFLGNNHISGFAIDDTSGKLEPVPGSPLTGLAPYSIAVDPSGRYVFVGDDAPQLSVYSLSRANGALNKLPDSPFMFGGLEPKLAFAKVP